MAQNVSNLYISESFQNIVFVSASEQGNVLATALGIPILSSSISASYAYSSSVATQAGSATSAITAQSATSASFAESSSLAARNLLSQSNDFSEATFYKGDGTTLTVDYTPRKVIETVKNGEAGTLAKGTPVYVSGSVGNASIVYAASASRADRMPAAYVLDEQLTAGQEGTAIVVGFINGVNTSAFAAGDNVYVGANGGYTNVKPTGSNLVQKLGNVIKVDANGSGVITGAGRSNDLPNITSGYTWVGNADGVPTATPTSSFIIQPFPYTGSAGIQGNLNVDGPVTASNGVLIGNNIAATGDKALKIGNIQDFDGSYLVFEADGLHQVRFLHSDNLNAIELTTSGSVQENEFRFRGANTSSVSADYELYIKTDNDNDIVLDPFWGTIGNARVIINSNVSASGAITASAFVGDGSELTNITAISASHAETASLALGIQDGINANFGTITATSASFTYLQSVTGSATIIGDAFVVLNNDTPIERYAGIIVQDSGSNNTASLQFDGGTNDWFYQYEGDDPTDFGVVLFGPEYATKGSPAYPTANQIQKGTGGHHLTGSILNADDSTVWMTGSLEVNGTVTASTGFVGDLTGNADTATSASHALQADNADTATTASYVENAVSASFATTATTAVSATSASLAETASFYDGSVVSASFAESASVATFADSATSASYVGPTIEQNLTISGSVNGEVKALSISSNTASLDCSLGNFFTLTLVSGSNTHLTATNIQAGQTVNLRLTQPTTASTIDFEGGTFEFPGASPFTASAVGSAQDIISFVTFDGSTLYGTGIKNLG